MALNLKVKTSDPIDVNCQLAVLQKDFGKSVRVENIHLFWSLIVKESLNFGLQTMVSKTLGSCQLHGPRSFLWTFQICSQVKD